MTDKTFADVADKAVDKIADGASHLTAEAGKILDGLGQMAPHAWEVVVRQQMLEAWAGIAGWCMAGAVLGIAAYVLIRIGRKRESDGEGFLVFGIGSAVVASAMILVSLGVYVPQLINPEYYAAKAIVCGVTGNGCEQND